MSGKINIRYDVQRAYQHLQAENSQLREEIVRLQDKEASEPIEVGSRRAGGHQMMARSSPDGQQDVDIEREGGREGEREAAQHQTLSWSSHS